MKKTLPVGISDFVKVREKDLYYVDKTLLIAEWLGFDDEVTLITRPRRFGKTLNMTMLHAFFDNTKDSKGLFDGLAIAETEYVKEMNQWPVIYLSMRDCKGEKEVLIKCLFRQLLLAYQQVYRLFQLDELDRIRMERIIDVLVNEKIEETSTVNDSIYFLCKLIQEFYQKKVILLIDEYDTPMISAYERGYYEEMRSFFASLYGSAMKDNPYLERAMLTGIQRIAKENIFSELNNLTVCTVMSEAYQQYFGLTPEETGILLAYYRLELNENVKAMYDGYRFGTQEIYNPWSIINYAKQGELNPYWVNTAHEGLLVQALMADQSRMRRNLEQLITQGSTVATVDLQTSFYEIANPATIWGLFLNSGYLTLVEKMQPRDLQAKIAIPNEEVKASFRKIIERYGGFAERSLDDLFGALQRKDIEDFRIVYERIIMTCTSFHDGSAENAYHMLFLGMCVYLDRDYNVRSNIEQGYGRADILLESKRGDLPNFVIEFKQGEEVERLAQEALQQIHEKQYYAGLQGEVVCLGIAHNLKRCHIVSEVIEV